MDNTAIEIVKSPEWYQDLQHWNLFKIYLLIL